MDRNFSLMLARFPGNNQEHPRSSGYVMSLLTRLNKARNLGSVTPFSVSDTPITMTRNLAVKTALDAGIDYLLMIDSDLHPDLYVGLDASAKPFFETAWDFLMKRRDLEDAASSPTDMTSDPQISKSIAPCAIAAPYCGPPPVENVYVFHWDNDSTGNPEQDFKVSQYSRHEAAILSGIGEVAALPTGLIIYDMRVFKKLAPPWFCYEYTDQYETQKASTEDVYQTRNQSLLGMPCYCTWDSWAGHIKLKTVGKPMDMKVEDIQDQLRRHLEIGHHRGEAIRHING